MQFLENIKEFVSELENKHDSAIPWKYGVSTGYIISTSIIFLFATVSFHGWIGYITWIFALILSFIYNCRYVAPFRVLQNRFDNTYYLSGFKVGYFLSIFITLICGNGEFCNITSFIIFTFMLTCVMNYE